MLHRPARHASSALDLWSWAKTPSRRECHSSTQMKRATSPPPAVPLAEVDLGLFSGRERVHHVVPAPRIRPLVDLAGSPQVAAPLYVSSDSVINFKI